MLTRIVIYGWAMRIICRNGYYKFFPEDTGALKFFSEQNGFNLKPEKDYFTFDTLQELDGYIFKGWPIGLSVATQNYAGEKSELLKANGLTYNYTIDQIVPIVSVIGNMRIDEGAYLASPILPQAHKFYNLNRVTGFSGFYDWRLKVYKIERLFYD